MKYLFFSIALTSILLSCNTTKETTKEKSVVTYANTITLNELKTNLYTFTSDDFTGRETGEEGQKLAAEFLKQQYKDCGIRSPIGNDDYFQEIPKSFLPGGVKASENVVAYIEGTSKPDEIVVISAHYDHLGTDAVDIFNGADDDGSGTVAVLEIAQAFKKAKNEGIGPKRSILFLHLTAEEIELYGSKWYVQNPLFPLKNHVYLIGSDKLSTELHNISEQVNTEFVNLNLDYTYNDENDPNRFSYRSDHYNFAKNNIPIIFYFNGVHKDYHKPTDTAEKINYELLTKRTQLVFHTAWEIANRENRVIVDKK